MKHVIENDDLQTTLAVEETLCENTLITIYENGAITSHYLTPKDLKNLIGVLLHIQAKNRKKENNFDNLSNKF